mgnify:CR=1 FL=1
MKISKWILGALIVVGLSRLSWGLADEDPYLWLEEIESSKALNWVKAHNGPTQKLFESDPRFADTKKNIHEILTAQDRLAGPEALANGWVYNFWQDTKNIRGLYRRSKLESYLSKEPQWETILDLDELAKKEGENWVWKGSSCLRPEFKRCLLHLSRGGKDAIILREFDLEQKEFVSDGFVVREAKTRASWFDQDHLLIGTDFGSESLTDSGYPRIVKKWKRGTSLGKAVQIYEGKKEDMSVGGFNIRTPDVLYHFIRRQIAFYSGENFWMKDDGSLFKLPFPDTAIFEGYFQGHFLVKLRDPWQIRRRKFVAGSLLAIPVEKIGAEKIQESKLEEHLLTLFDPKPTSSLVSVSMSAQSLYLNVLDQVQSKIYRMRISHGKWRKEQTALPLMGSADVAEANEFESQIFFSYGNFLQPNSLYFFDESKKQINPKLLRRAPERFDAKNFVTEQKFVKSKDGTRIPYFLIHSRNQKRDGKNPVLLYGYGGFEISMNPNYLGVTGRVWLEKGGSYVVANIRGGGEFGPHWHKDAILENRQRAYEDFIAVAEDLVKLKITSPKKLAIMGGSNGGLLMGVMLTQRPDLFGAIVCKVPLADMRRYHKLLAGASWMAEYGNPDDPKQWEFIQKYSPYQNLKASLQYPEIFIQTSTKDDRVHPGHARKMVARLEEQGHKVFYYENIEGGHGAAANLEQKAYQQALDYTYLYQKLLK